MIYLVKFFVLGALLAITNGCTDSPNNDTYAESEPPKPPVVGEDAASAGGSKAATTVILAYDPEAKFRKAIAESSDPYILPGSTNGPGSAANQKMRDENLRKPIVYGQGLAGITMNTSYRESKQLLTEPLIGPLWDRDGATLYDEQVIVLWKEKGRQRPYLILGTQGYLGKLEAGDMGPIDMQTKFKKYQKGDQRAGAAQLIRDLYLRFEKVDDPNYNCLVTGRCRLIYGDESQANMVLLFPGIVLLIAKDEFQMMEVRVMREENPTLLANNVDVLSGDILVPNTNPFVLGQTKKEIFDQLLAQPIKADPDAIIDTNFIYYSWTGVGYAFNRSNYDPNIVDAEDTDVTMEVGLEPSFPAYLTIGGQPILVTQSADDITVDMQTPAPEKDITFLNEREEMAKLKVNTKILKKNAFKFTQEFTMFLTTLLSEKYSVIKTRLEGTQDAQRINKDYKTSILAFDKDTLTGRRINFTVSQEEQMIRSLSISAVNSRLSPFNRLILPTISDDVIRVAVEVPVLSPVTKQPIKDPETKKPIMKVEVPPYFTKLSGLELNNLVRLTDVDVLGAKEATIQLLSEEAVLVEEGAEAKVRIKPISGKERGKYEDKGAFKFYKEGRQSIRQQGKFALGLTGIEIGLGGMQKDGDSQLGRIASITSSSIYGKIKDICGMGDVMQFEIGMTDDAAQDELKTSIAIMKAMDPEFSCEYLKAFDNGGVNRVTEIYFVKERLVLKFKDRALSEVTIYAPMTNLKAIPGVTQ